MTMSEPRDEAQVLAEIVRRIVAVADPDRIILFGSRARGDAGPDSDYDLLVIGPSAEGYYRRTIPLYQALAGLGVSKDVMWWTPEEAGKWRKVRTHLISRALSEGRVLYERAA